MIPKKLTKYRMLVDLSALGISFQITRCKQSGTFKWLCSFGDFYLNDCFIEFLFLNFACRNLYGNKTVHLWIATYTFCGKVSAILSEDPKTA